MINRPVFSPFSGSISRAFPQHFRSGIYITRISDILNTRTSTRTVWGYSSDATISDGMSLLTVPAGIPAFNGARLLEDNTWSTTDAEGADLSAGITLSNEDAGTNFLLNSATPATQTTGSLAIGTYTCWVDDGATGSATVSAGTATITGGGAATAGSPLTFQVTAAGTVTVTVAATVNRFQLEGGSVPTSYIPTTTATVTRAADANYINTPSVLKSTSGAIEFECTLTDAADLYDTVFSFFIDTNNYMRVFIYTSALYIDFRVAGVTIQASKSISTTAIKGTNIKIRFYWDDEKCYLDVNKNSVGYSGIFSTIIKTGYLSLPDKLLIGNHNGTSNGEAYTNPNIKCYTKPPVEWGV